MEEYRRAPEVWGRFGIAGYIAAAIGAVLGAFGLAAAGIALGFGYSNFFIPEDGFEALEPVAIGLVAGAAVGAGLGAQLGVATVRHSGRALNGALTAVVSSPIPVLLYRFVDTLESPRWLLPAIWVALIAAAAILARGITWGLARAGIREARIPAILWLAALGEILLAVRALV
jgi:hypothetical protein